MRVIDTVGRNLRYATRSLITTPGFTAAASLTLALGIGANTALFSVISSVMLTPLPYGNPENLVMIWRGNSPADMTHLSLQEVVSYRDDAASFETLGAYIESSVNLAGDGDAERLPAGVVTGEQFGTLGVAPLLGRVLTASDAAPDAPGTVVLGHGLWVRRLGAAPDVVGRTIRINGAPRTIVGIMPSGFRLPMDYVRERPTELWMAGTINPAALGAWGNRSYLAVGRLKPGVGAATATSELEVIARRWIEAGFVPDQGDGGLYRSAIPLQAFLTGGVRSGLLVLFGAVGIVLLIACANVVNLLLARADARRRDVAVRSALGAGRRDILAQLLTESLLLSAVGGAGGLGLAYAALQVLLTFQPAGVPRIEDAALDTTALLFTGAVSVMTGLLFGLLPSIQMSKASLTSVLNESGRGGGGHSRTVVRRGLVVLQLAFSVVLVIGAGLLLRSLIELQRIDLGFNPERVLTAQLVLPAADYPNERVVGFYRTLLERLAQLPGVETAGAIRVLPLSRAIGDWSISIEGRPSAPNENPNGDFQWATPGYQQALGLTVLRGRWLTEADREQAPAVVVINDTMARRYWPGQDALGKRFQMGGSGATTPMLSIVGIVKTLRHDSVVEEPRAEMYLPHAQLPTSVGSPSRGMALTVKTAGDPLALASALRETVRVLDRNLPISDVKSMEEITATALARPRFATLLLGGFALLALTLAAVGTHATVSLLVSQRAGEIGIRMALGAEKRAILASVLGEGLALAAGGIVVGLAGALFAGRMLGSLLYGVSAFDPLTFALVPAILAAVALLATWAPAHRAASVNPVKTLRHG
jgi:putative ABC transport system permease protein